MITAAQLDSIRAAFNRTHTTPCSIQRKTSARDGMGGQTDTWAEISAPMCYIAPAQQGQGQGEKITEGRIEELSRFKIRLPAGTDVTIQDRIVALGVTYEVSSVEGPRTDEKQRVVYAIVVTS